jgi:hypothetical protein
MKQRMDMSKGMVLAGSLPPQNSLQCVYETILIAERENKYGMPRLYKLIGGFIVRIRDILE